MWILIFTIFFNVFERICSFQSQDEKYGLVSTQTDARRCSPVLGNFVDVDLPEVAGKKCMSIRRSKLLLGRIAGDNESDVRVSRTDLHSSDYHIIAADFTDTAAFEAKLTTDCGLVSFFRFKTLSKMADTVIPHLTTFLRQLIQNCLKTVRALGLT